MAGQTDPAQSASDLAMDRLRAVAAPFLDDMSDTLLQACVESVIGPAADPTGDTSSITLYVARCSRCNGTMDDDGGEYQPTPEKAVRLALGTYGEFERRDGKLVCSACCLAEDEPDV